jgi:hypothetical protein
MNLHRRDFLHLTLSAGLSLGACAAPRPNIAAPAGLNDSQQLLDAYLRLSGSFDDRLIIWWMTGTRYGVVDARAKALYGMQVGMFHRYYPQPDGTVRLAFFELTYYTDLETGKLLETFDNPYTGETNRVRHVRLGPEIRQLSTQGLMTEENEMVQDYRTSLGPAVVNGDRLWIPASVEATIKFPKPTAPEILLNIYTTVQGSLSDALNPAIVSADCTFEFHNVLKWEPWMQMFDHPGHMMSTASGRKLQAVEALPQTYRDMANQVHPKYMGDPLAALKKYSDRLASG